MFGTFEQSKVTVAAKVEVARRRVERERRMVERIWKKDGSWWKNKKAIGFASLL